MSTRQMSPDAQPFPSRDGIKEAALDPAAIEARLGLARSASETFAAAAQELHVIGHILGPDRINGVSPFNHGDDVVIAVSMLLRIAGQLVAASADLTADGRHYAASALIRQLVEIEYLAWAFETKNEEAAKWLRSTKAERQSFFTPAKLRKAADGRFRGVDYGHHCEWGGHPTPIAWQLFSGDASLAHLMLSDALGHMGRIWDHCVCWAHSHPSGQAVLARAQAMSARLEAWTKTDRLTDLQSSPAE